MSRERLDTSFLDSALHYASQEARHSVADSLACYLHNDGHALEGNTEVSDTIWFARRIFDQMDRYGAKRWETVGEDEQRRFRDIASAVLSALPEYQLRIAHRLITLSKVVRDIERAARSEKKRAASPSVGAAPETPEKK